MNQISEDSPALLPPHSINPNFAVQRARVRCIARSAMRTPGARLAGLILFIFAAVFARWFVEGVSAGRRRAPISPFVYTMRIAFMIVATDEANRSWFGT
jgi:hypothetical protein